MFFSASGFSIFEIIGISKSEYFFTIRFKSKTSFLCLTKDKAIQSTPFLIAKTASLISLSVKAGREILVLGRFTPFFEFNTPP